MSDSVTYIYSRCTSCQNRAVVNKVTLLCHNCKEEEQE